MLGRTVNYKAVNAKNFNWPFEKTADVLKAADITFVNLEAPLVENCPVTNEGMIFCADTRHANGLAFAGVDLASMANNHAKNYGIEGINTTSNVLSKNSILTVGTSGAVIKNVKGVNFAFLAYNDVTQKQVETATLHAVGNHPHWIQPIEFYRKKPILYSQGNFVFDQMWSEKTRIGIVARFVFYNTTLIDIELFPIKIYNYGQPHFLVGDEKGMILAQLEKESATLSVYRR